MKFIMHKFSPLSELFNLGCLLNNGKYVSRKQRNQTLWLSSTTISHLYQQCNTSHKFEDKCVSVLPMYLGENPIFPHKYSAILIKKKKRKFSRVFGLCFSVTQCPDTVPDRTHPLLQWTAVTEVICLQTEFVNRWPKKIWSSAALSVTNVLL